MLALHGFDVYGLEVSEKGAETARRYAQTELTSPSAYHYGEGGSEWEAVQRGAIEIVVGDFFHRGWESRCGGGEFDLIYDYTVCIRRGIDELCDVDACGSFCVRCHRRCGKTGLVVWASC
jgi:hypothetical protein